MLERLNVFLFEKHAKLTRVLTLLLCVFLLGAAGYKLYFPSRQEIVFLVNGEQVYSQPLGENVTLLVRDGTVRPLAPEESVSLDDSAAINVFEIQNGYLRCAASNCSDQQCVYSGEIAVVSNNDMLVCYEHNLIVQVK